MRLRTLLSITLLALCHLQLRAQSLTNPLPASPAGPLSAPAEQQTELPNDPGEEMIPVAEPEPVPASGLPLEWEYDSLQAAGDTIILSGHVVCRYRGYVLRADHVVYHRATTELEADGHLELTGGPEQIEIHATHGDLRLNMHTARFYNVSGSQGMRMSSRSTVYATNNPFLFTGRVLLQLGEDKYRLIDGTMTNCLLPHPDWRVTAHSIRLENGMAATSSSYFRLLDVPIFYLPYLRHPVDETGRESGLLIPVISNSSIKGFVLGTQIYTVLNRSMDMVVGAEYFSHRGWAPNGDFRYRGAGMDRVLVRWNSLLDRGIWQTATSTSSSGATIQTRKLVNQGGVDIVADGRKDFGSAAHVAGSVEYLSSYAYRLIFNDNYSQAVSSQVSSKVGFSVVRGGYVPSVLFDRFETFASSTNGDEARIFHLPTLRLDAVEQPLGRSPFYWGMDFSASYMSRSEPHFHARNIGRFDFYPHLSLPLQLDGWSFVPSVALRETGYTASQRPDLNDLRHGVPTIDHDPLNRTLAEAAVAVRPPSIERDFDLPFFHRVLRHVVEPELDYRFAGGVGRQAQRVLLIDTSDIATDTNEVAYSLTQRFYLRPLRELSCGNGGDPEKQKDCKRPREWASWQIAQKFFLDPQFGGAVISGRRNIFDSTLDLTGVAFLDSPQKRSPVTSRLRFEAIDNVRVEWDVDYDPRAGQINADNLFAGYQKGATTIGFGHALLNAVDESRGAVSTIKSQQLRPFLMIGKPSKSGLNFAANSGYDFVENQLQYAGVQANYNWDCCGLTVGYRRFRLGSLRDETQYLYSFTIANFGSVGDIRRSNTVFRDPDLPPAF